MDPPTIDVAHIGVDPCGQAYRQLIDFCCARSSTFELDFACDLYGRPCALSEPGLAMERRLQKFAIGEKVIDAPSPDGVMRPRWTYRVYRVCDEAKALLMEMNSLFSWCRPAYPEDLCFYRIDGSAVLAGEAHNQGATLHGEELSEETIRLELPLLELEFPAGLGAYRIYVDGILAESRDFLPDAAEVVRHYRTYLQNGPQRGIEVRDRAGNALRVE